MWMLKRIGGGLNRAVVGEKPNFTVFFHHSSVFSGSEIGNNQLISFITFLMLAGVWAEVRFERLVL